MDFLLPAEILVSVGTEPRFVEVPISFRSHLVFRTRRHSPLLVFQLTRLARGSHETNANRRGRRGLESLVAEGLKDIQALN